MKRNGIRKAQAALDFMVSYGIFITIIIIALAVIYSISTSTRQGFSQQCVASSGFSCAYMFLFFNGTMNISLVQATGGDIILYGIACSSSINGTTTSTNPQFGNVYTANTATFYPANQVFSPVRMPSGTSKNLLLYCYGPNGIASFVKGQNTYTGYVWLNYTLPGSSIKTTQLVASVNAQYV